MFTRAGCPSISNVGIIVRGNADATRQAGTGAARIVDDSVSVEFNVVDKVGASDVA